MDIGLYLKAIVGFLTPGLVIFFNALTDASDGGGHVTGNEWSAMGLAMLLTGGTVYAVKNEQQKKVVRKRTARRKPANRE